jgi:glycerol dehydrogenase-like iron-containing ADH family enzyme
MKLNEKSKGFGDTIAKFTEVTGIAKAVEFVADTLGMEDCGCAKRQEILNNLLPYSNNNNSILKQESVVINVDGQNIAVFD